VLAWDEVMDADVDQDVVICAWRTPCAATRAESGHDVSWRRCSSSTLTG